MKNVSMLSLGFVFCLLRPLVKEAATWKADPPNQMWRNIDGRYDSIFLFQLTFVPILCPVSLSVLFIIILSH